MLNIIHSFLCCCPDTERAECPVGFYSNAGATECTVCSAGYICPMRSTTPTPTSGFCDKGGYCPDGKVFTPCPTGMYNPHNGSSSFASCWQCPSGWYRTLFHYLGWKICLGILLKDH